MSDFSSKPELLLSEVDRKLILITQKGMPVTEQPYHQIAEKLGISADEVIARLSRMKELGAIRRIAAVPNHYKLGYNANGMTVWDVDDAYIQTLGKQVGALSFVSHCYRRPRHLPEWSYNLFAMVHGHDRDEVQDQMASIKALLGQHCQKNDVLYSKRILKKTGMRFNCSRT